MKYIINLDSPIRVRPIGRDDYIVRSTKLVIIDTDGPCVHVKYDPSKFGPSSFLVDYGTECTLPIYSKTGTPICSWEVSALCCAEVNISSASI